MSVKKYDINDEMAKLLKNYEENFDKIAEINGPLINYIISTVNYTPPISYDELYLLCLEELWRVCKAGKREYENFVGWICADYRQSLIRYIQENQYIMTVPRDIRNTENFKKDSKNYKNFGSEDDETNEIMCEVNFFENLENSSEIIDERLLKIKDQLKDEEWELLYESIGLNKSCTEMGKERGVSRQAINDRVNRIKKRVKKMDIK